ncbi:MAG: hypothetical protein ACP5SG_05180, partial [Dissulfurimicrobium sp.]
MQQKKIIYINRYLIVLAIVLYTLATSAFSLPSFQNIKHSIQEQLEKLWEKTPIGKEQKEWRIARQEAISAVKDAEYHNALIYAKQQISDAQNLLLKAYIYANNKEYYEAIYAAKKTKILAIQAKNISQKIKNEKLNKAKNELANLALQIKQLHENYQKINHNIPIEYNEL